MSTTEQLFFVRLNHPLFRGILSLRRVPKFLRFTCTGIASCARNWDALDQLDDEPELHEQLLAGVFKSSGKMHIDRTVGGRRVGEWRTTVEYDVVDPQPLAALMRDRQQWQEWCLAQAAQKGGAT